MARTALASLAALATLLLVIVGSGAAAEPTQIVTYPAPAGRALSTDYSVRVRPIGGSWASVDAHEVTVDRDTYSKAAMVGFDMSGPVEVEVTKASGSIGSARVRPLSYRIAPVVSADGKTATFVLPRPLNVSFEVDGDILHNVHVFAGPIDRAGRRVGAKTITFAPGLHAIPGNHVLHVPSNTTVRIAGGALVQGSLAIVGARNVVVEGRGIIDPSRFFPPKSRATIRVDGSRHVGIRDITLLRGQNGAITISDSADAVVAGVREINADPSSDGIYVVSSRDVLVDGAFLRTSDDAIAVYATTPWSGHGGSRNVTVRNSTLWADVAHAFLTGTHGNPAAAEVIRHVELQNVDVLEHDVRGGGLYEGALAVNVGNRVTVRDVRFDDIRVEDFSQGQVVNLKVFRNWYYNTRAGLGIDSVFYRDVTYTGTGDNRSRIRGYTPVRGVRNVTFENFVRNGQTVLDPSAGNFAIGPHTSGIDFRTQPKTRIVDDASTVLRYSGRWAPRADAASTAGAVRTPMTTDSSVYCVFAGRQARIYGTTGRNGGRADVFVDGAHAATVDTYSAALMAQQIWFDTGVLGRGRHRIELRFARAKNVLSTGTQIAFDKLEIIA